MLIPGDDSGRLTHENIMWSFRGETRRIHSGAVSQCFDGFFLEIDDAAGECVVHRPSVR